MNNMFEKITNNTGKRGARKKHGQKKYKISASKWVGADGKGVIFWYKYHGNLTFDIYLDIDRAKNAALRDAANVRQVLMAVEECF